MVKEKYKPDDSDFRAEEEAMLREMVDLGVLESEDFVRFGPPNTSRIFLKEELTSENRPYKYPTDVNEKPSLIRDIYEERVEP